MRIGPIRRRSAFKPRPILYPSTGYVLIETVLEQGAALADECRANCPWSSGSMGWMRSKFQISCGCLARLTGASPCLLDTWTGLTLGHLLSARLHTRSMGHGVLGQDRRMHAKHMAHMNLGLSTDVLNHNHGWRPAATRARIILNN